MPLLVSTSLAHDFHTPRIFRQFPSKVLEEYPPDERECITYATEIRKKLVPPQYARSAHLYPKYAGLCTFNAAYLECMNSKSLSNK